ncbi:MAG: GxxExxY protein [Chitinophagaceae bacterium]|nr:GxxExxY protein [Chitinophagaceae bacterium]
MFTKTYINSLTYDVNAAIIEVHRILGPGLLENIYHKCLKYELDVRGIKYLSEFSLPFHYKDLDLTTDFRCDLLIESCIMLELKAVQEVIPYFKTKIINHMLLTETPKGILVNFNVVNIMKEGHFTFINKFYNELPE